MQKRDDVRGVMRKRGAARTACGKAAARGQRSQAQRRIVHPNAIQHPKEFGPPAAKKAMEAGIRCNHYYIPLK